MLSAGVVPSRCGIPQSRPETFLILATRRNRYGDSEWICWSVPSTGVTVLKRAAPIFPVRGVTVALAFYQRLGFTIRRYDEGYGFAKRDRIEIHLGASDPGQSARVHSAYLWVDDADALAREWQKAGVEVHMPGDTEWGQRVGAVVDPDGNVLRFGSPPRS